MDVLFALCLVVVILRVGTALGEAPVPSSSVTLNKTCLDGDIGILLEFNYYKDSCPEAEAIVFSLVESAVSQDPRMAASLLRLHFHDCFVNGCDASVLLDDTDVFVGKKTAPPNLNSLRGFEVIDDIKAVLESVCPTTVSCADILEIAARDSVILSGGPGWEVQMGRKDSLNASKEAATNSIPAPTSTLQTLVANFQNVGLSPKDVVAVGENTTSERTSAHTIGKARCSSFTSRIQGAEGNSNGQNAIPEFIQSLQRLCSGSDGCSILAQLDLVTPATFDNQYYVNLLSGEGLLPSDQTLVTGDDETRSTVESYVEDPSLFFEDFRSSMIKLGNLANPTGIGAQIRRNCRMVN